MLRINIDEKDIQTAALEFYGKKLPWSCVEKVYKWLIEEDGEMRDLRYVYNLGSEDFYTLTDSGVQKFLQWAFSPEAYTYPSVDYMRETFSPLSVSAEKGIVYVVAFAEWDSVVASDSLMDSHRCFMSPLDRAEVEVETSVHFLSTDMRVYKVVKV